MKNLNQAYKKFSKEDIIYNLLAFHIDKIDFFTLLIKKQNTTYNELFDLLAEYPDELKFCKQLFTHRENPEMNLVFFTA